MSAETRKQKRELRKFNRTTRKEAFGKFIEAVKAFKDMDLKQSLDYKDKFKQIWPALKPTIEFAISLRLTGGNFDKAANEIIVLGENIYNSGVTDANRTEFTNKLTVIWDKIEFALEVLKILTDNDTDVIIDKIIEIGEWLFEN